MYKAPSGHNLTCTTLQFCELSQILGVWILQISRNTRSREDQWVAQWATTIAKASCTCRFRARTCSTNLSSSFTSIYHSGNGKELVALGISGPGVWQVRGCRGSSSLWVWERCHLSGVTLLLPAQDVREPLTWLLWDRLPLTSLSPFLHFLSWGFPGYCSSNPFGVLSCCYAIAASPPGNSNFRWLWGILWMDQNYTYIFSQVSKNTFFSVAQDFNN